MRFTRLVLCLAAYILLNARLVAQPSSETLKQDERFLNDFAVSIQKITGPEEACKDQWWIKSRAAAARTGPHLIHALMKQSESWKGEEVLLYVPLVVFLERAPTLKLLEEYQHSKIEAHRTCAENLISELDSSDTVEAFRKYSRKK